MSMPFQPGSFTVEVCAVPKDLAGSLSRELEDIISRAKDPKAKSNFVEIRKDQFALMVEFIQGFKTMPNPQPPMVKPRKLTDEEAKQLMKAKPSPPPEPEKVE